MKNFSLKAVFIAATFFLIGGGAPQARINRPYEVQTVKAANFPNFVGVQVNHLALFRFEAQTATWKVIPFQIDPVTSSGSYFGTPTGVLHATDELVFLLRDAGDEAPQTSWPAGWGTPVSRYEIQIQDGLENSTGYVYLTRLPSAAEYSGEDLISADRQQDKILSQNYRMGFHPQNGLPVELSVSEANGGDGQDILDRLKIHIVGTVSIFGQPVSIPINEENSIFKAPEDSVAVNPLYLDGPVHVVRDFLIQIRLDLGPSVGILPLPGIYTLRMHFYPYSMMVSLPNVDLSPLQSFGGKLDQIRFSFDYNPHAAGMTFMNPSNTLTVDGKPDVVNPTVQPGQLNWMMVSGAPGTVLHLALVPQIGQQQLLYYHDNLQSNGMGLDGTQDTGDLVAIGDSGFLIKGNITSGTLSFLSYSFFLPGSFSRQGAENLYQNLQNPPVLSYRFQQNATSVASEGTAPRRPILQVYPNPFSLRHSRGVLRLIVPRSSTAGALRLTNILGQEVFRRRLSAAEPRTISLDISQLHLPPGIYWIALQTPDRVLRQKLLILP